MKMTNPMTTHKIKWPLKYSSLGQSRGLSKLTREITICSYLAHSVLLWDLLISKIYPDMRPPAKLSYRSAIHKKVVFGAVRAWTLPQIQGEVGGDQEPPGNTSRYPTASKKKITYYISYISCNWLFINFFVRPTLIGVTLLIVPRFTKGAPRRSGRTKKFIKDQL